MESKMKLLKILEILNQTDEDNPLTAMQICEKLRLAGFEPAPERKSVCRDINVLISFGYKIKQYNGKKRGYYIYQRDFNDWELKLMMDAVKQIKCITEKDTAQLCGKIIAQSSEQGKKKLQRVVSVHCRNKNEDEYAKDYIANIINAMYFGKKVEFKYTERDKSMERRSKFDGYVYRVSPYTIALQNETYYLIGNVEKYDNLCHYRLDRIEDLVVSEEKIRDPKLVLGDNPSIKIQEHINTSINHFSGKSICLKMVCTEREMNIIYDFAGDKVRVKELDSGQLEITVKLQDGEGLISWLVEFSDRIRVIEPERIREQVLEKMRKGLENYECKESKK